MMKRHLALLILATLVAVLLFVGQALAADVTPSPGPGTIYISTFTDHRILRIDATTITLVHDGSENGEVPEGLVVGPDKRVYYCDSSKNRIFRMNLDGTNWEQIYSGTSPTGPEGPTFNGAGDLIFDTRNNSDVDGPPSSGLWKIAGVAGIAFKGSIPAPVNLLPATAPPAGTGSTWGEGTAFAPDGTLLIVDRSNNRVLKSSPPYNSTSVLISSGLNTPIGVAADSAGNVYVANSGSNNIVRLDTQSNLTTFTSFDELGSPAFMRFDPGTGNLFVATSRAGEIGANTGKVWSVDSSGSKTLVKALTCSGEFCTPPPAVGLGLIPTSASITQHFDANHTSNLYNFGSDTVRLSFPGGVITSFDLTYTRTDVSPTDFNAELFSSDTPVFPTGTTCFHYPSDNGFCAVYAASKGGGGVPIQGTDYNGKYRVKIAFFTQDTVQNPGMAHEHEGSTFYDEDMLIFFSPNATPGSDPAGQGETDGFSKVAMVNKPLVQNGNFCGFDPPLNISGRTFEAGREIDVEFRLTTGLGCTGNVIRDAIARLSLARLTPGSSVFVNVRSAEHEQRGNLFEFERGERRYEFDLSTNSLKPGTYALTVFSNKFKPQTVFFKLRGDDEEEGGERD